jgi:hypothetical protein
MRPTNIFNKSRRKNRKTGNYKAYKQQAAAEYKQALERLLLGSSGAASPVKSGAASPVKSGAASPVKKIDPTTGAIIEILNPPQSGST